MFDRNGFDPFARNRRNSLSKKSKMKQIKQQVAPSVPKQTDFSQVCDTVGKTTEHIGFFFFSVGGKLVSISGQNYLI